MPAIIVNDYTWRQTPEAVIISMPLVGHPKKVDLFAIDNYIKASYPPFILELFLWGTIVEETSECAIGEETAVFTLKKTEVGVKWPSLMIEDLDKDKKRAHRSRALELARVSAEQRAKARSEKCQAVQRQAVRAQIDLDTATLNDIEAMRDSHRKEAMRELEDWRGKAEKPILEDVNGTLQENRKSYRAPLKWFKNEGQTAMMTQEKTADLNVTGVEYKAAGVSKEPNKNGTFLNDLTVQDPSVKNLNDIAIKINKIEVTSKNNEAKNEPKKLLSSGKYQDSSQEVASSSSSDSSSSDANTEDSSIFLSSVSPSTGRSIKEMNEKELRKYYLRKEKKNSKRGKDLVQRLLSGRAGYIGRRNERIFNEPEVSTPRPRSSSTINVKFSEREFPTPARESHRLEEQEWLEKQAEARRKNGFVSEDLSSEEQDPQWLKDKGDEFFKAGNYLGAISAYTHGIKLSGKMSSLYTNRSAAHYAAKNYRRCAEDCSTALELMVPKCEGNRDSRARCHARLGAALCKLSSPQHGIPELEAALKLTPENETIKRDLLMAKRYFEVRD